MNLNRIALLNIRRRKVKAAFAFSGIFIAVATVITLLGLSGTAGHNMLHQLERYGANIVILPKSESLPLSYGGISLGGISFELNELSEEDLQRVHEIPFNQNIAALGPVVLGVAKVMGNQVLVAGVDFQSMRVLRPWWEITGGLPGNGQILAGSDASELLGIEPGELVSVNGKQFEVSGTLNRSGSQDDHILFTSLGTAQELFNKEGQVSMVEVAALCHGCPIEDMVIYISEALPDARVMAIQQVVMGRMEALDHFQRFAYGVSVLIILVAGLMVLVTMMGSVRERSSEIGIFRAIGYRQGHVMRIILLEVTVISLVAGLAAYPVGLLASRQLMPLFTLGQAEHVLHPGHLFDPLLLAVSLGLALVVGLCAGYYPARTAARLDPNQALRSL
ncbi:ABC transporter permease [Desulfonatronovibrio hydrogenovorans]|uniref:ABC transporter permease n=1 Tax=Desulfonatronovibrio hydrogenovorans TaxID=53245 RepID=UPI00048C8DCA|nr:FtsX-like permease family protein [Desulfonatronovibrio hydrogenovorans]